MIITQFRKFTPLNITVLAGLGVLLCVGVLRHLPEALGTPLFSPAVSRLFGEIGTAGISPEANVIVTLALTLAQALYINSVMNRHNFFTRPGFLIALMYLTLASLSLPFLVLSPVLLCNFLLIRMLDKLLNIYHRQMILRDVYDLGLLVGVGSLLYFPFIAMLLAVWGGLRLFRPFNWREWIASLMGVLSVYFLLWVAYFWQGMGDEFLRLWTFVGGSSLDWISVEPYDYLAVIPVFIILILFLVTLRQTILKRIVHVRKSVQLLFVLLLISLGAYFLRAGSARFQVTHFLLAVPTLSIYMAYYFNYAVGRWFFEGLYLLLVFMILVFHVL